MKTDIFVPDKLNVGCVKRSGTYTGELAYVIYWDAKGKLRKETSWQSWRDKKIEPRVFENVPTEGFVLNKKVGGYSSGWNHRSTYARVYDPRGFEFEISVENLLYLLENTSCIKGKGIEGKLVYGWQGKELVLIPEEAPDYAEVMKYVDNIKNKPNLKGKDLTLAASYLDKNSKEVIYMGRFDEYEDSRWLRDSAKFEFGEKKKKVYVFMGAVDGYINRYASIGKNILEEIDNDPHENFPAFMDKLLSKAFISPNDESRDVKVPLSFEEFSEFLEKGNYHSPALIAEDGRRFRIERNWDYTMEEKQPGERWAKNKKDENGNDVRTYYYYFVEYKIDTYKRSNSYWGRSSNEARIGKKHWVSTRIEKQYDIKEEAFKAHGPLHTIDRYGENGVFQRKEEYDEHKYTK